MKPLFAGMTILTLAALAAAPSRSVELRMPGPKALHTVGPRTEPNHVTGVTMLWLNNKRNRDGVRFPSEREVRLCMAQPASAGAPYPSINVSWDGMQGERLKPGACVHFDATNIAVSPATPLPGPASISVQIETLRPKRAGPAPAA